MKITREGSRANIFSRIGCAGRLMVESFAYAPHVILNGDARRAMLFQLYSTGIRTRPVITVVGLFTGMILETINRKNRQDFELSLIRAKMKD